MMKMENPETFQSNLNSAFSFMKQNKFQSDPCETAFIELASSVQTKIKDNLVLIGKVADRVIEQLNMFELRV
jgi:hypothetical protein